MLEITDQLRHHGDWVEEQMRPIPLPTPELRRIDATVPTDADVLGEWEPPNPNGRAGRHDRQRRTGRLAWAAMAAAALVALLVASLVGMRSRPGQPDATVPTSGPSGLEATGPDSVVLPRSTPDGLMTLDVATSTPTGHPQHGLEPTGPAITQLFGVDLEAKLELRIEPSRTGADQSGGVARTVRGTAGRLMVAGQATVIDKPDQSSSYLGQDASNDRYSWYERDAFITASFKGLTATEALEVIDEMQWASLSRTDGFVLASGAELAVLLPPTVEPTSGLGVEADVHYVVAPGASAEVDLVTCPAGTGGCPGAHFDYAAAWLNGSRAADGSITVSVDGRTPDNELPTNGFTLRIWQDGATAQVDFGPGQPADRDLADRLLSTLEVTDRSGLDRLEGEIVAGLGAMPVLAAADLPGGRVEVHGVGLVSVTCLAPSGAPLTCGTPNVRPEGGLAPTTPLNASAIVDGHWILAAASSNPGPIAAAIGDSLDATYHPTGAPLPVQASPVTVGDTTYQLALVVVPDDTTAIMLSQSTPNSIGGGSVSRPVD